MKKFLAGNVAAIDFIKTNRAEAEKLVADRILKDTTKPIAANLVTASFDHITFTADPVAVVDREGREERRGRRRPQVHEHQGHLRPEAPEPGAEGATSRPP